MNTAAIEGVAARIAKRFMGGTAVVYRPAETAGGASRLTTTEPVAVASVAMWVERSMLSPTEEIGPYSETRVAQYIGHCALGTDIRRNDIVAIHGYRFRVLGILSGPTHAAEMKVTLDMAAHDGEAMP